MQLFAPPVRGSLICGNLAPAHLGFHFLLSPKSLPFFRISAPSAPPHPLLSSHLIALQLGMVVFLEWCFRVWEIGPVGTKAERR